MSGPGPCQKNGLVGPVPLFNLLALFIALHLLAWFIRERSTGDNRALSPITTTTPIITTLAQDDDDDEDDGYPRRAFPLWNNHTAPLPCLPAEGRYWSSLPVQVHTETQTGILYVKVPKTGSSTGSSVTIRLAQRIYEKKSAESNNDTARAPFSAQQLFRSQVPRVCQNRFTHGTTHQMGYDRRDKTQSVLWSLVRDPSSRLVSAFFHFFVSRAGNNASDPSSFRTYAWNNRQRLPSFQVRYLSFRDLEIQEVNSSSSDSDVPTLNVTLDTIRTILNDYDFVGVTERLDESVVALQMLLGLETEDVMHLDSKLSGGYDDGQFKKRCVYIQPSFRTPEINQFLDSPMWRRWSKWDAVLHRAANRSLDLTIDGLGRDRFQEQLNAYRKLHRYVNEACSDVNLVPCDASRHELPRRPIGQTGCVAGDAGCGIACIDQALAARAGGTEEVT